MVELMLQQSCLKNENASTTFPFPRTINNVVNKWSICVLKSYNWSVNYLCFHASLPFKDVLVWWEMIYAHNFET